MPSASQAAKPFIALPTQTSAPVPIAGSTGGAVIYTDGTSVLASINSGAYAALAQLSGSPVFTTPVTITTATAPALTVNANATSGNLAIIRHSSATTTSASTTGLVIDMSTLTTPGAVAHIGLSILIPATTRANSNTEAALLIQSTATTARIFGCEVANDNGTLWRIGYPSAVTLTTVGLTGISLNLNTNLTPSAGPITGLIIAIAATTRTNGANEGAIVVVSNATAARILDLGAANTSGTLVFLRWQATATLAGAVTGLNLDLNTNVTGASQAVSGLVITLPAAIANASYCATFDFRGTAGTAAGNGIVNVEVGAATVLTGQLVGIENDISTNVTPGAFACIGQRILIPATTRANTAGEGALVIDSQATAARSFDVAIANTSGTPLICRYRAATTPNAVVMCTLDMSTNVTSSTNVNVGLDIIMLAADRMTSPALRLNGMAIYVNAGIPIAANGANGDIYFDTAAVNSQFRNTIYQRQGGAWKPC